MKENNTNLEKPIEEKIVDYEMSAQAPVWNRIRSNKMLLVGGILVIFCLFMAFLGPLFVSQDPLKMNVISRLGPPSSKFIMGTDQFGRDVYSRVIHGAKMSLSVACLCVLIGASGGLVIGAVSGFFGGWIDNILMRIMDAIMAFPGLLLAIGLAVSLGPSFKTISIIIGILYIPAFARMMRGTVLAESKKEYVEGAKAIGQKKLKILFFHIGPNCISPLLVLASMDFALAIIIEAELSFLGVGVPPPTPSWGSMLLDAKDYMEISPYPAIFPGIMLTLGVLGFNLLGDGLRDFFDPRTYK